MKQIRTALRSKELDLSSAKTEMLCMQGPLTLPPMDDWPQQHVGGPDDLMAVLGAQFSIALGFAAALPSRSLKTSKTWYTHKQVLRCFVRLSIHVILGDSCYHPEAADFEQIEL
eukprot:386314-Amphidinium_carterae.1